MTSPPAIQATDTVLIVAPSVTPELQARPTATIPPTVTPIPTTALTVPAQATCEYEYFFKPAPPGCPQDKPVAGSAAEQPFEGGVMIWLDATDSVYVFYEEGDWQRFEDTWSEDLAERDPAIIAPEGLFQPIRGFGKVWREHPEVHERLGWALGVELAFESELQDLLFETDNVPITFIRTFNGQVFALTTRNPDQGDWAIAAS